MKTRKQPKKKTKVTPTPKQTPSPSDSPAVMAAKDAEQQADREARQGHTALDAARQDADRAAKALAEKAREVETVKNELEAVSAQLGEMPLDDPAAQPLGGRLRHCELLLTRLQDEAGGCRETLTVAQRHASTLEEAAARAEAAGRNATRWVRLVQLMEDFPVALEQLLAVVRERTTVLHEADQESHGSVLARVGRARLFPQKDQIRGPGMDDLLTTLSRHMAGLTLSPSAPLAAFSVDGQVSPEPVEDWVPVGTAGGS